MMLSMQASMWVALGGQLLNRESHSHHIRIIKWWRMGGENEAMNFHPKSNRIMLHNLGPVYVICQNTKHIQIEHD